jgi:hypothetical protein
MLMAAILDCSAEESYRKKQGTGLHSSLVDSLFQRLDFFLPVVPFSFSS